MKIENTKFSKSPTYIAAHVRRVLQTGGSAPHSEEVQRFFKEEVQSRGWYTAELRKVAGRVRRAVLRDAGLQFLIDVADCLFRGRVLEEKVFAVFLLEKSVGEFGAREFKLFGSWLDRVSSWADHDCLVHYLIGPMILQDPLRARRLKHWMCGSRWHRRAAAVALIRAAREHKLLDEVTCICDLLLDVAPPARRLSRGRPARAVREGERPVQSASYDKDHMVQKGVGWLLRETAKANRAWTVRYLMTIRERAPRLVLRTACETLPARDREKILGKTPADSE